MYSDPFTRDPYIYQMYVSRYMVIPSPGILTYTKYMPADTWWSPYLES